jgi:hypothetical protein
VLQYEAKDMTATKIWICRRLVDRLTEMTQDDDQNLCRIDLALCLSSISTFPHSICHSRVLSHLRGLVFQYLLNIRLHVFKTEGQQMTQSIWTANTNLELMHSVLSLE